MKSLSKQLFFLILTVQLSYCQISYQDQAAARGVGQSCGLLELGGGVSFIDFNNDGWDDITMATQGSQVLVVYKNTSNGFFIPEINLVSGNDYQQRQPIWVDYDNDGDYDLYVTSDVDGNRLYENNDMTLTDVTSASGLPMLNIFTFGASWGDYNKDGYLDVFLSNRDVNEQIPNYLYKNNGDGTFTDVSEAAGIGTGSYISFCSAFFDYNNDGWQDIYVSNDKVITQNLLYHNNGDGTFTELGASTGTNLAIDAMSTTIGDYNNDGWFDIYVTNSPEGNILLKNNADGTFTDVTSITGTGFYSTGWGSVFLDADNDGDLDLYVSGASSGMVPGYLSSAFYENMNNDTFSLLSNGSFNNDNLESYANAMGDIDNDGYPEIIVSNSNHEDLFLWKNLSDDSNNWLKVKLEGTESNKQGVGSTIEVGIDGQTQYRYTLCGEGYLGQNSASEFFGIGSHTSIDYVKVTWLSGIVDVFYDVSANQTLNIVEGITLSTDENHLQNNIVVNNPVLDKLHIKSSQPIQLCEIYDGLGKIVFSKKMFSFESELDVNTQLLSPGIYFCRVQSYNNTVKILKIIKK